MGLVSVPVQVRSSSLRDGASRSVVVNYLKFCLAAFEIGVWRLMGAVVELEWVICFSLSHAEAPV